MLPEDVRLSVITPTLGRPSLPLAGESLIPAGITTRDEWVVVADGPEAAFALRGLQEGPGGSRLVRGILPARGGGYGGPARNHALSLASGTHVLYLDDDDLLAPGSLDRVRQEVVASPDRVLLFRFQKPGGSLIWETPGLFEGNVGSGCAVLPRRADLAPWTSRYQGDFDHLRGSIIALGTDPVWIDYVLSLERGGHRPEGTMATVKTTLTSNGRPCVICARTGAVIFLEDAVRDGDSWISKEFAPAGSLPGNLGVDESGVVTPVSVEVEGPAPTPEVPTRQVKRG